MVRTRAIDDFTADAVVPDDGRTSQGRDEILGWLGEAASEFTYTSTRLSVEQDGDEALVVVLLEGDFPGGRVELRYRFALDPAGLIRSLSITA